MNNETGLDWMARNVHVWPDGMREVLVCYPRNVDALIWSCVSSNAGWITKEQWLTRRAELQNKPSWEKHRLTAKIPAMPCVMGAVNVMERTTATTANLVARSDANA